MTSVGVNVTILKENEILLIKREDFKVWCPPGGGIDPAENFVQAAIHEAQEKTGLKIELDFLVGICARTVNDQLYDHVVIFAAHPIGGTLQPQEGEAPDVRFFNQNELPSDIMTWHRRPILDACTEYSCLALRQIFPLGFDSPYSREELDGIRDHSPMSQLEFFQDYFNDGGNELLEVGSNASKE